MVILHKGRVQFIGEPGELEHDECRLLLRVIDLLVDRIRMPAKRDHALGLDPLGPLRIRWAYLPRLAPWLLRFLAAGRPAPYEAAMMISDMLTENGTRDKIKIEIFAPSAIALPVAGPKVSNELVEMIGGYGIHFSPNCKPKLVRDGEIEFENGRRETYDVLVGIPPHRAPDIIKASGLTSNEWIPVDRVTLRVAQYDNVFAIGDVTEIKIGQLAIPKAGIFAEGEAKVVAQEIIDEIEGQQTQAAYNGQGYCYVEVGRRMAGYVEADLYNLAGPAFRLDPPSAKHYEGKRDFERSRLKEWLL